MKNALRSALLAGVSYAAAEAAIIAILPAWLGPADIFQPLHLGVTACLFAIYPAVCAPLAVIVALLGRWLLGPGDRADRLSALSGNAVLAIALAANGLSFYGGSRMTLVAAGLAVLFLCGMVLYVFEPERWRIFRPLTPPWVVAVIPLGAAILPAVVLAGTGPRIACAALYAAALLALAYSPRLRDANRRGQVAALAAVSIALIGGAAAVDNGMYFRLPAPVGKSGKGPNVLFVVMDTVRADHLSVYGYTRDTTPNLTKLATETGTTVYRNMHSVADWTLPSHASMFTGLYPSEHGSYCDGSVQVSIQPLQSSAETLAERFDAAGYSTAAVVSNTSFLGREYNMQQGFQYYAARRPAIPLDGIAYPGTLRQRLLRLAKYLSLTPERGSHFQPAGAINKEIIRLLPELQGRNRPWLVFANYMDAHSPYDPPPPYRDMYSAKPIMTNQAFVEYVKSILAMKQTPDPEVNKALVAKYDGGIAYLDAELGRLFAELRRLGVYDDTMIVVTADHGEAFGEHKTMEHGISVYEEQIRVPLIVKWPKGITPPPGEAWVSGVDLMPTILYSAHIAPRTAMAGRNLLEAGAVSTEPWKFSESKPCAHFGEMHPRFRRHSFTVAHENWKLIESTSGNHELFDLAGDTQEERNVYAERPEVVKELSEQLKRWRAVRARRATSVPAAITPEERERLKSLGYVQ